VSDPARYESLLIQGAASLRQGNFKEAYAIYSEWIRENPECSDAYMGRGRCAAGLGEHVQALEDFASALDIDPNSADSFCARALSHAALGNHHAALSDLDASLRLRPDLARRTARELPSGFAEDSPRPRLRIAMKLSCSMPISRKPTTNVIWPMLG